MTRLSSSVEVVLQPFGSFIAKRDSNRFDVLNARATAIALRFVENVEREEVRTWAMQGGVTGESFDDLVGVLCDYDYLVEHGSGELAMVSFVDEPSVLKATRAEIEITNRCNLACLYCYAETNSLPSDRPAAFWLDVLRDMQAHGLRAVLFSGGEPFLHPDFDEILAWAAKRFIVEVNSNGLLIDKELASTLSRYNLKSVQVSLDSPTPSHHDAMRGLGSHAAAMAAIEALAHAGVPTRISTVVTSANVHLLDEIAALANDMGATCSALPVVRAGRASKISDHAWRSEFIATALRRVSSSDSLTPTLGFDPLCQAQVGYVSVSHAGHLKPCNMREHFFDRTGGRLVESPEAAWWRGFLGETSMSLSVSLANAGSASEAIGAVHDDIDRPCALQLAVACSGSLWERQPGQHRQDDAIPT